MILFPRWHCFEFHDLAWCPALLRHGITECLSALSRRAGVPRAVAPVIMRALQDTGTRRIVDLCSGCSGPVLPIYKELAAAGLEVDVILTDKYPDHDAFAKAREISAGHVRGYYASVDAASVPEELGGMRTLFNAFHHFRPEQARAILRDAHDKREPIAIFEITSRSLTRTLTCFPSSLLLMLGAVPFMQKRSLLTLLCTYLVPILPVAFAWDGLISCLRSYTVNELHQLSEGLTDNYEWRSGRIRLSGSILYLTYFLGCPSAKMRSSAGAST
jgi:hypothetical protein